MIHIVFPIKGSVQIAIAKWPAKDLNPGPMISVQMFQTTELSGHEFN